jgi:hypothetical protein
MDIGKELMKKIRSQYGQLGQSGADAAQDLNKYSKALETKEATGSGGSGQYSAPLFGETNEDEEYCDTCDNVKSKCVCDDTKKVEATEATGASSSGQYSGPSFLAKSQSKKDWRGASKPLYPGGKIVKIKKKCLKFPYCNQGDINALKLSETDIFENIVNKLSKEYNLSKTTITKMINEEILKNQKK